MKNLDSVKPQNVWNKIPFPDQVKRLVIITIIILTGYFIARRQLLPDSFERDGFYQKNVAEIAASLPISYMGESLCVECHNDMGVLKSESYHRNVSCEVCHGPGVEHVENDPETAKLSMPTDRSFCTLCHGYTASKPTGFPQIDPVIHNPVESCINCHNPHDPTPSEVPRECGACHGEIARTKAVSPHTAIPCIQCHETTEEHKIDPRSALPSKPRERAFCGTCHSYEAESSPVIPRIDVDLHESGYMCWQCHYPHYPEK